MDFGLHAELIALGFASVETHISRVYLTEDAVFKLKRPVNLGFLDFTTLAARERACRAEVALNRRLAADVYIDVVALLRDAEGRLAFVPPDQIADREVIDWAVHMRRLADQARADVRLSEGTLDAAEIQDIAQLLARFHRQAERSQDIARFGLPESVSANVEENFAQVEDGVRQFLASADFAALQGYQRSFLRDRGDLLRRRVDEGFVRDGHGDLRLEHIYRCGRGEHVIIDCIEFNDRFRFADVCADIGFLSMDLRRHARPDLAEILLATYARTSADYGLYQLVDFYESYRAVVRAKVSSFLAQDPQVSEATRERAAASARSYYLLALSAPRPGLSRLRIIVCMGMIASGKSTLAERLALRLALPVLSADRTRKELLGVDSLTPLQHELFQGAYAPQTTERVYATLRERAGWILGSGRSVILDGTFRERGERARVAELAEHCDADLSFLLCECPRETTMQRLRERSQTPNVSDGREEIYDALARSFDPLLENEPGSRLTLDTRAPLERTLEAALTHVGP